MWTRLYKTNSSQDGGSLYQLRNLINRRNVVNDPKKDMNACEEFFELVTKAHILAAVLTTLEMKDLTDPIPSSLNSTQEDGAAILETIAGKVISEFVDLSYTKSGKKKNPKCHDNVLEYAKETLTMGLLLLEFKDAVREGDGDRVLRCWKYLFLYFRATGHTNYCLEALNLLSHYYYLLPPRYAEQLKWSRFINTQGCQGANISADLHVEHLNRICKEAIQHLGANKSPVAVKRIGKVAGIVSETLHHFDEVSGINHGSGRHTRKSDDTDLKMVLTELMSSKVFTSSDGRTHKAFKNFKSNIFNSIDRAKLIING